MIFSMHKKTLEVSTDRATYFKIIYSYVITECCTFNKGIKLFKCDVCEQSFSSNIALKEHSARHTDTKSYKCDDCGRFFRQISCLRRHQVTHSSDMPFSCKVCSKKFSQMTYLRSHMRTHTGTCKNYVELCKQL